MQYSKKEGSQLINKIERLKEEIDDSSDYDSLDQCAKKLKKLRDRTGAVIDRRKRNELNQMCEVAERLIQLKTKKLKKRIIHQIARESPQGSLKYKDKALTAKQKKLAYSKSFDFFNLFVPQKTSVKPQEEDSWQDRTEANLPRNGKLRFQRKIEELEDQLASYKRQMSKLEQGRNSATLTQLCLRLGEQEGLFEQQMGFKARQKALQADELRQRLRRSEERSMELKNRLLNQQKRQQDYIQGLKNQLSTSGHQLQMTTRENRRLQEELNKIYFICDGYKKEVSRLMEDVQQLQRQKRQFQQNQLLRMKDNSIRRELETLQLQEKYMREMENLLQAEKDRNCVLQSQLEQLQKRNNTMEQEIIHSQAENERLQEMLDIREEQTAQIKKEMFAVIQEKSRYGEQLLETRSIIAKLQNQITSSKQKRSTQLQKKSQSLKQIKQILEAK